MPRQRRMSDSRASSATSPSSSSCSSVVRVPSALASSASVSVSVSDRPVSPVTSATDVTMSRAGDDKDASASVAAKTSSDAAATTATTSTTTTTTMATSARRSSRARTSLAGTYNVDVLADSQRKRKGHSYPAGLGVRANVGPDVAVEKRNRSLSAAAAATTVGYGDIRNVSGETLVNDGDDVKDLSQDAARIKGLDAEKRALGFSKSLDSLSTEVLQKDSRQGMELERVKGKNEEKESQQQQKESLESRKMVRRQSTRLQNAAETTREAVSTLGKRGREAMESGMGKAQALGRSGSSRLRDALRVRIGSVVAASTADSKDGVEGVRPLKKARVSSDEDAKASPSTVIKSKKKLRAKRWLTSGLYTGQERDFNPRLTETKNKLKRRSGIDGRNQQARGDILMSRKHMPMPMFAGERLLNRGRPFNLPYDVFSPLSERQPKPNEWRKTSRNLFVGDALTVWRKAPKLESSKCICTEQDGCDESCQNRFMFYECNDGNCNVGAERCQNRAFAHLRERYRNGNKYDIGVEVLQTEGKGFGVRANRSFEPGQIIVEYAGEIITQEECERRMKTVYKKNDCYYLMTFHQGMIIDATRGSIARFVNHSCEPNCKMVKWTVEGEPRMALFAGEGGIMTGDELTYDYNFDPFSQKNVQKCLCGAESCRGVLGPKISERPKPRVENESQTAGLKRKSRDISRGANSDDDEDGENCPPDAKKAKLKAKSSKQGQKQKLSAAAKRTASLAKNVITGQKKIVHKMAKNEKPSIERASIRSSASGRRVSESSLASAKQKKMHTSRTTKLGKLQSPFSKLRSNVKGIKSSTSFFPRSGTGNLTGRESKRRSVLQKTIIPEASGSDSSLNQLIGGSEVSDGDFGRRSVDGRKPKSSASSSIGKLNAGVRRVVGNGGLGRRRTVSGARLRWS